MRKIGTLLTAPQAERFHNYLASQGIENRVDPVDGSWEVWIYDEEQVPVGKAELQAFTEAPESPKYAVKAPPPKREEPPAPRPVQPRGTDRMRVTIIITSLCVVTSLATNFGKVNELTSQLTLTPSGGNLSTLLHGEFWRIYTPMFLHFNLLHLGFNVYMFWILGGVIERLRGSWALLFLILLIAPVSHLTQYEVSGGAFGGLSGVVYGLFGFLWMRSMLLPEDGFFMPQVVVVQMIIWALLGLTNALGPIANGAHFGGLFAGMVLGAAPRLWRDR